MSAKHLRAHAVISGRVQGVFFRASTQEAAAECGVTGWVRNKSDGTVEAMFEGEEDQVYSILEWCKKGSPSSEVEHVAVNWGDYTGEFERFDVRY